MNKHCILCKNDNLELVDKIDVSDLCKIYKTWLPYNVKAELKDYTTIDFIHCHICDLKFFDPPLTGSPEYYSALSRTTKGYYLCNKDEYEIAKRFISDDENVLDIGCGVGYFKHYVKGKYTGLDVNVSAIHEAYSKGINIFNADIYTFSTHFPHSHAVVVAFQVLEHIATPDMFIKACLDTLTSNGKLIISVPSDDSYISLQENALLNMPPHHVSRWTDKCLINISQLFNIELIYLEHDRLSPIHFEYYIQVLSLRTIRTLLRCHDVKMVDGSLKSRMVNRLSKYVSGVYKRSFFNSHLWPYGHSVTAVYRT